MEPAVIRPTRARDDAPPSPDALGTPWDLGAIYTEHFDFVWRSVRRLGVPEASVDDAVQDVFVVAHDRLAGFEARSSLRTWLFGIVRRVVRNHRPAHQRAQPTDSRVLENVADPREGSSPHDAAERAEATRTLHALLDALDDDKREAFVLADLEQMPAPEIADALGVNVNTVYARVRAARRELEEALARVRARGSWRQSCPTR